MIHLMLCTSNILLSSSELIYCFHSLFFHYKTVPLLTLLCFDYMGSILTQDIQKKTEEINALSQHLKYRDTNPCWVNNREERIKFLIVSFLRDALSGYWLHQDDRYSGKKLNKD